MKDKYQAYDMAILNLMKKHPECRTYESILERAREDKYLETIVHNALNHLFDNHEIMLPDHDRNDITNNCKILLPEEYEIIDNPHFQNIQDSIGRL